MNDKVPVILPVSREVKAAWVRQSQAEGRKLTDWLLQRIAVGHEAIKAEAAAQKTASN